MIGVFDRSHYEDVVVVRVRNLVEPRTWKRRYATINRFEEGLVARGTTVVKCFLHISKAESRDRLLARLDKPDKRWKFNPGDVDSRAEWDPLLEAYSDALERCNDRGGALARRPGGPQVVPELGDHEHPGRAAGGDGGRLADAGVRRRGAAPAPDQPAAERGPGTPQ